MSTTMKKELAKAKKVLHPNSRKSIAIMKKTKKISNREKVKLGSFVKQNLVAEKILWIQQHMVDVCPYTPELTAELLETYMGRNDEELEQIALKHSIGGRKNRQHASREDILRMTKEREKAEYDTCGIEIPDILNTGQCEMLQKWDGELRYLPNFKFRRFGKKDLERARQQEQRSRTKIKKGIKSILDDKKSEKEKEPSMVSESAETTEASRENLVPEEDIIAEVSLSETNLLKGDCSMIVE
ncbi:translation machinery-associated protein 16 [Belonocnema kinseyi]|uniref:translation machinery-associated protein 16 n=1 Tax=Belonocnema kinseyi TaxID=2817044 RepID=UPI00143DB254|nr:translation machinery-associated protein 16 [Belonocnema kinseyi]